MGRLITNERFEYHLAETSILQKKEVREIEINIFDQKKYVSLWLTRREARDDALRERLQPIFDQYKAKSYKVVVFESGNGNLTALTKDLLSYNHLLAARNEAAAER